MDLFGKTRMKRTSTTILEEDFNFLKEKNITFATAIRTFVHQRRQQDSGDYVLNAEQAQEKLKKVTEKLQKTIKLFGQKLKEEDFQEVLNQI